MSKKLKPCPFCGGTKINVYSCFGMVFPKEKPQLWIAECVKCDAHGPFRKTEQGVIKAWNKRSK